MRSTRVVALIAILAGAGGAAGDGTSGGSAGSGAAGPKPPAVIRLPPDVAAPEVTASASPTEVRLGGRFTLFITATFGDGVEVNLREPLELGPAFEVTKKLSEDRPRADGKRTREWQVDVTAWELGELRIPPIAVTFTVGGRVGQVDTAAVRLRVDGVLGEVVDDPTALRDLHPPTELIVRDWFWLWIAAAIGGVLGAATGLWRWRRRRRRRTARLTGGVVAAPRRIDLTGERALEALLAIKASGVLDRDGDRRRGYADMVSVLRDYLGARYRVASRDLTSCELARRLRGVTPAGELELIEAWLGRCDLVKYGGLRTTASDAYGVLDDARALIVTTTQAHDTGRREAA